MTLYGKIKDDKVITTSNKPTENKVSCFWLLNDASKKEFGWLPIIDNRPVLQPWMTISNKKEIITDNEIIWDYDVTSMSLEEYKTNRKQELITNTEPKFPPLWKQLNIALERRGLNKLTGEGKIILDNMDTLNNFIDLAEEKINNAATYEDVQKINIEVP